ncbi:hypothetical protein BROUX41_004551 [Berkeleyomyces rouxiae]|uniref:uncharacterized protein n=1 Tax=Berkeleyomyces rouxiae TaxID=2035830 RepID=UPI003B789589
MVNFNSIPAMGKAALAWLTLTSTLAAAGYPDPEFRNGLTGPAPIDNAIQVRFKIPSGVCRTAMPYQEQRTGYITIPADGDIPEQNVFFWYVRARERTNALTLWLSGTPGQSSLQSFFTGQGPCNVIESGMNKLETAAAEWGWDRASNLLFVDQPIRSGLSYDTLMTGSLNLTDRIYLLPELDPDEEDLPEFLLPKGTFPSKEATITHTKGAAKTMWKFMQAFYSVFPEYKPPTGPGKNLGLNIFSEGYGGKFVATFADYFAKRDAEYYKNERAGQTTYPMNVKSIGILNGCVDPLVQSEFTIDQAWRNPYGLKFVSREVYLDTKRKWNSDNSSCRSSLKKCYALTKDLDYDSKVPDATQKVCNDATIACAREQNEWYIFQGGSLLDITHRFPDVPAPLHHLEYLNQPWVQKAMGVPLNYTEVNFDVGINLLRSGDWAYGPMVPYLANALKRGVNVGLMYGDRNFMCNWAGGEALSMAVAEAAGGQYADKFPKAGYSSIYTSDSYVGGKVRQFGGLSYSRIEQAGQHIAAYQPSTALQVFGRIIKGVSVSDGQFVNINDYSTKGQNTMEEDLDIYPQMLDRCYLRAMLTTCTRENIAHILAGEGVIISNVWYAREADWTPSPQVFPSSLYGLYVHPLGAPRDE